MTARLSPKRADRTRLAALAAFVLGCCAGVLAPGAALANRVQNGGFELGPDPNQIMTLPTGSTAIQGWTVMGAPIDYVDEYWAAREGTRSVALNGTSAGALAQSFATLSGQSYEVRFYLSGDPFSGVKHVRVSAAGQTQDYEFDAEHVWPWDLGWTEKVFNFTASALTTTLTFTSLDAGGTGPVIDSVVVNGPSPVGVDEKPFSARGFALAAPIPNPSPDGTAVTFIVPIATPLRLTVQDARGRTVRVLADGAFEAGAFARAWDGRTTAGARSPAGLYFIRLSVPGGIDLVRKAVLVP